MKEHLISLVEAEANLLSAATYLAENIGSSDGYAEAMREIVAHYIARDNVDLAAQLADTIEDTFIRDRLLSDVAEKCAALEDDDYALQLAEAIEDVGSQSAARERIAVQKAVKNDFDKAFEIIETLSHPSDALSQIAVQQAANGDEEEALETVSEIEFHASKIGALQGIADHFYEKGEADRANELLEAAVSEAKQIEFTEEKIRALLSIAAHFIEAKQFDKSLELLAEAKVITETLDGGHRDSFLTLISLDFLRSKDVDSADDTLDLVKDKTQIASCLAGFSTEFDAQGERSEALEALDESYAILKSQRDNEVRDSKARFSVLGAVATRYAIFEKPERAIEIALENPMEDERNQALAQIARICVSKSQDGVATQAINAIEDDSARMYALISLSDAKNKLEKKDEGLQLLDEAAALCESVSRLASRSEAFNELAKRFVEYGEIEKAHRYARENLQTISKILDESNKAVALSDLAGIYEANNFELGEPERKILQLMLRKAEW